jgi:hypothetical protein
VSGSNVPRALLKKVLSLMSEPTLVSGEDVVHLGIPEGQRVGLLLDEVRRRQLDGLIASRDEALAYLHQSKG